MVQFWKGLWSDESGQGLTEYALFIGMISVALTLIAIGIAGGVLALALALGRGQLLATLARTWHLALRLVTPGAKGESRNYRVAQRAHMIPGQPLLNFAPEAPVLILPMPQGGGFTSATRQQQ